ncbi:RNB domain-containing ribonuclease [Nocardioides acrostichi]|uniref:RNB domain-containing ribonuclease n=1 Tax=Nocardioides acrostichi TaxID=2784339 RepID=A0A930UZY0_9ACTN|nr:RNB domain-containing ribonuclease [Nocardioides acrostichi]MBF4162837.1 RNB domain-containing ribonuclease [Nocardioides acrostichi]
MTSHPVVRVRPRLGEQSDDESVPARALRAGVQALQEELGVQAAFPPEVTVAAEAAAASPRLPSLDRTDLPFLTIDPEGARDLDQAMHLARDGEGPDAGFVVHYAIADVAAFVRAGDAVDVEAHERGETLYGADSKLPLHPPGLSEGAASLLPDEVRPALLWTIRMDAHGERTDSHVERALVRSVVQLTYEEAHAHIEAGTGPETLGVLAELGPLRLQREASRGGVSLPLPEQEVVVDGRRWHLEHRARLPVEDWNAQISLLTGFAAAAMMVYARVGLLRTLPPADPADVQRLHRTARALGIDWPAEMLYPDFVRTLDPAEPAHAAMVVACTRLLRGSGYVAFDGELPAQPMHAALATEYAHVTAPLRRLGDRYAGEICLALCAGTDVPGWVLDALPGLPETLKASARRAGQYERGILDLVEAGVLDGQVGSEFDAVVVEVDESGTRGQIVIAEPAVEGRVQAPEGHPLTLGSDLRVRLVEADVEQRRVRFEPA